MHEISIAGRQIGRAHKPFVIAEMSGNHGGSLERALAIVEACAKAGADALKLQTYTADTMTLDIAEREFFISDANLWQGETLYNLYQKAHTPWAWHEPIFQRARELGMLAFSSAFDASSIEFLATLDVPCYKVASFENSDHQLIRRMAQTGKPIIMSTGMAYVDEIAESVKVAREAGCKDLMLLKCTSNYPANPRASNLLTIAHMEQLFQCPVGLSDHTLGIGVAVASVALGGAAIEKHVTLDRADGAVDSDFSANPDELAALVRECRAAFDSIGQVSYGPSPEEVASRKFRRSLYFVQALQAGDLVRAEHLRAIRPGLGLEVKYLEQLIGRQVKQDIAVGTAADWSLLQ